MTSAVPALAAALICAVPPLPTVAVPFGGMPLDQLPGTNQLPVASVQLVCARAGVTTAPTANNTANARTLPSDARITSPPVCRQRRCPSTLPPRVPTARMRCEFMTASPRARPPSISGAAPSPLAGIRTDARHWPLQHHYGSTWGGSIQGCGSRRRLPRPAAFPPHREHTPVPFAPTKRIFYLTTIRSDD